MDDSDYQNAIVFLEYRNPQLLSALPDQVGFQLFKHEISPNPLWFLSIEFDPKRKWLYKYPFANPSPPVDQSFITQKRKTATVFFDSFDQISEIRAAQHQSPFFQQLNQAAKQKYPPSSRIRELFIGFQVAAILDQPVFAYCANDDYQNVSGILSPTGVETIFLSDPWCEMLYSRGKLKTYCNDVDLQNAVREKTTITLSSKPISNYDYFAAIKDMFNQFVGQELPHCDIIPEFDDLQLIASRAAKGKKNVIN